MIDKFGSGIWAYPPGTARIDRGTRGCRDGDVVDLDADGGGGGAVRAGPGKRPGGGKGGLGRCRRRGGAVPVHDGGAVPVDGGDGGDGAVGAGPGAVPAAAARPPAAVPGLRPGQTGDGRGERQPVRQPAGAGQRRHPPGAGGVPPHGGAHPRRGVGRPLYAGGDEHRVPSAHTHHRGLPPGGGGEREPLRHPPRGRPWICCSPCWCPS